MQILYTGLNDFLRTFSAESPWLWALLIMAVMSVSSLVLYAFWEVVIKILLAIGQSRHNKGAGSG